jgi:hypothetical protein
MRQIATIMKQQKAPEGLRQAMLAVADALWEAVAAEKPEASGAREVQGTGDPLAPTRTPLDQTPARLSARDMLIWAKLPTDRLTLNRWEKRLERFRAKNFGCYDEIESSLSNSARYIYAVAHLEALLNRFRSAITPAS